MLHPVLFPLLCIFTISLCQTKLASMSYKRQNYFYASVKNNLQCPQRTEPDYKKSKRTIILLELQHSYCGEHLCINLSTSGNKNRADAKPFMYHTGIISGNTNLLVFFFCQNVTMSLCNNFAFFLARAAEA